MDLCTGTSAPFHPYISHSLLLSKEMKELGVTVYSSPKSSCFLNIAEGPPLSLDAPVTPMANAKTNTLEVLMANASMNTLPPQFLVVPSPYGPVQLLQQLSQLTGFPSIFPPQFSTQQYQLAMGNLFAMPGYQQHLFPPR
jgi:hypothetical protein